jgi:hypothetical protein
LDTSFDELNKVNNRGAIRIVEILHRMEKWRSSKTTELPLLLETLDMVIQLGSEGGFTRQQAKTVAAFLEESEPYLDDLRGDSQIQVKKSNIRNTLCILQNHARLLSPANIPKMDSSRDSAEDLCPIQAPPSFDEFKEDLTRLLFIHSSFAEFPCWVHVWAENPSQGWVKLGRETPWENFENYKLSSKRWSSKTISCKTKHPNKNLSFYISLHFLKPSAEEVKIWAQPLCDQLSNSFELTGYDE